MKLAIAQMVLGVIIVGSYLFIWVMGGVKTGWWMLFPRPYYVFTVLLVVGLLLLGWGIVKFVRVRRLPSAGS